MAKYRIQIDCDDSLTDNFVSILDLRADIEPQTVDIIVADIYFTLNQMASEQTHKPIIKQSKPSKGVK